AHRPRVGGELFLLDNLKDFERDGATEGSAAVSAGMCARAQQVCVGLPDPEGAHGKSAADGLGHRNAVGRELLAAGNTFQQPLPALESSCPEMAALHF